MSQNKDFKSNLFINAKKAMAFTEPYLLFFQFQCPHCEQMNVIRKGQNQEFLVCSNSECRKIIMLENYKDIA